MEFIYKNRQKGILDLPPGKVLITLPLHFTLPPYPSPKGAAQNALLVIGNDVAQGTPVLVTGPVKNAAVVGLRYDGYSEIDVMTDSTVDDKDLLGQQQLLTAHDKKTAYESFTAMPVFEQKKTEGSLTITHFNIFPIEAIRNLTIFFGPVDKAGCIGEVL